jgi:general stress protein 26
MKTKIWKFIKTRKVAFVASIDANGAPNMKAMLAPRKIENNTFYFTTNTPSMRVQQFLQNNKASIYFYRKGLFLYKGVMLVGTMEVLTDDATKKDIWRSGDTMYYKLGVTDPDYCVLKFTADSCRYYCNLRTENIEI